MTQTPPPQPGPLSPQQGVPPQGGMPSPGAPVPQGGHGAPQPGYGAPQPGYGGPPPGGEAPHGGAPARKPSKAPTVLLIIGALILVLSVVAGVVLAVVGFGGVASDASKYEIFESGSGTVTAAPGDTLQLYAEEGVPVPECTIDGPAVGSGTIQTSGFGLEGREWSSFDSFTAEEAGTYDIQCGDTPVMVGPPVSIGGIFAGLGGILLAVGGGALGLLLLAIGAILLILRKRRA